VRKHGPLRRFILRVAPWLFLLVVWSTVTDSRLVDPLLLATPSDTLVALIQTVRSGELIAATGCTLGRALGGFGIAVIAGVPLGLLLGGFSSFDRTFGGVIDALRSMPATALYPVFLLAFGAGDSSKVAVTTFISTWALAIYTAYGVRSNGDTRRFLLRLHRAPRRQILVDGLLFPALPSIVAGMRTIISIAFVVTIGIEMIVGTRCGLGQLIFDAQNTYRIPTMYAAIVASAATGVVVNWVFIRLARMLTPWEVVQYPKNKNRTQPSVSPALPRPLDRPTKPEH
jgi:ABC-type nitrate/sulfonate/bicarbonate transport system permease component